MDPKRALLLGVLIVAPYGYGQQSTSLPQVDVTQAAQKTYGKVSLTEATKLLEEILRRESTVPPPPAVDTPPVEVVVNLDEAGRPAPAPSPPPPPPPPPPGPAPFMPPPPQIVLERYRSAVEVYREQLEHKLDAGELPKSEYKPALREYMRRIDLYRAATKLNVAQQP